MNIPYYNNLSRVYFVKDCINEVIEFLQSQGIKAGKLSGPYLISDRQGYNSDYENKVLVFHFNGKMEIFYTEVKKDESYLVCLIKYW